jgi:phosphoribosylglycinamide formyltransferase-1
MRLPPAKNIAVLISGRGSNLKSIVAVQPSLGADIKLVLSNKASAGGLIFAESNGIDTVVLSHREFGDRQSYDEALVEVLRAHDIDVVVLAGFMRVLGPTFISAFSNRILNIHPSLLPSYPGLDAQGQALEHGAKVSGCTVHLVDEGTDTGPIVDQAVVPVLPGDTRESLAERILVHEHRILPRALGWLVQGRLELQGRNVVVHEV